MSFLTDLFKGNFGGLGKDITHDPLGSALAIGIPTAIAAPFLLPELGAALGVGGGAAAGAAEGAGGAAGAALGAEEAGTAGLAGLGLSDVLPGAAALGTGGIGSDAASAAFAEASAIPAAATPTAFTAGADAATIAGGPAVSGGDILSGLGGGATGAGTDTTGGLLSSIINFPTAHPLLTSLGVGGAGMLLGPQLSNLINKVPQQKQLQQLQGQEAGLAAQSQQLGTTLTNPLVTGQLPPDAMASWQSAVNDAINTTKARYANLGLSGSTMESDALAKVTSDAQSAKFNIASTMAQTGMAATNQAANAMGLQDAVFGQLMNAQVQQDAALQQAIARFAAASALGQGNKTAQAAGQALTVA